jgi:hypothetical protein
MTDTPNSPAPPNDGHTMSPTAYGGRVTVEDGAILDAIHRELASPSISADRRDDLESALAGFADEYCFDWLWEEPELKDHPNNPFRKGKATLSLSDGNGVEPTPPSKT